MARIDRFIKPLCQTGAERLIIAAGETIVLAAGVEKRPMTTEPSTAAQVNGLLQEIVPPELTASIASGSALEFPYVSPHGTVLVTVSGGALAPRVMVESVTSVENSI